MSAQEINDLIARAKWLVRRSEECAREGHRKLAEMIPSAVLLEELARRDLPLPTPVSSAQGGSALDSSKGPT